MTEIKSENPCCAKYIISDKTTYICANKPTAECSGDMKAILKKNFEKCKEAHEKPDAAEPLTCGTDEEYAEVAE